MICVAIEITLGCCTSEEKIDLIEFQKFGIMSIFKITVLRFYGQNISRIIYSVKNDWTLTKTSKSLKIMRSYARIGIYLFYVQMSSAFTVVSFLIVANLPFFTSESKNDLIINSEEAIYRRMLPQRTKCLFLNISTISYVLVYVLQSVQLALIGFINVGVDVFFFSLAMHISGQLEILYKEMSNFEENNNYNVDKRKIVSLCKRHWNLLEDAHVLEKTFSVIIMMQLAINITGISLFGTIF